MSARTYRTKFVGELFGKTTQWVYYCERSGVFARRDGTLIIPRRTIPPNAKAGYRAYSLQDLRDITDALYRRGIIDKNEFLEVMGFIETEALESQGEPTVETAS